VTPPDGEEEVLRELGAFDATEDEEPSADPGQPAPKRA
jgi:hypothetical protein